MSIKQILERIRLLFELVDDVKIYECEETSLIIVETNICYIDTDNYDENFEIYLSIEVNPSNNWEYNICSYLENALGEADPLSIHRRREGFDDLCKNLNKSFELEEGQESSWKSPNLLYKLFSSTEFLKE